MHKVSGSNPKQVEQFFSTKFQLQKGKTLIYINNINLKWYAIQNSDDKMWLKPICQLPSTGTPTLAYIPQNSLYNYPP